MHAEPEAAESNDDVFVAYASRPRQFLFLSLQVFSAAWGFYLFKISEMSALGAWLGIATVVFSVMASTETISLLIRKGPMIKADKSGLFIYGQTIKPVPWEDIASADHGMVLNTPDVPTTYILKVTEAGRHRLRPSYASAYTRRRLRLSSFGSTASGKDIRRILKMHIPHVLWHIASDRGDKRVE